MRTKNKKIIQLLLFSIFYILYSNVLAQGPLPPGDPITYDKVSAFLDNTAKFLYTAGITVGVITLVVSGIMFFWAKGDTEAKTAKGWFRNGIIGAFIILATGVIIKTIEIIVRGGFFGP